MIRARSKVARCSGSPWWVAVRTGRPPSPMRCTAQQSARSGTTASQSAASRSSRPRASARVRPTVESSSRRSRNSSDSESDSRRSVTSAITPTAPVTRSSSLTVILPLHSNHRTVPSGQTTRYSIRLMPRPVEAAAMALATSARSSGCTISSHASIVSGRAAGSRPNISASPSPQATTRVARSQRHSPRPPAARARARRSRSSASARSWSRRAVASSDGSARGPFRFGCPAPRHGDDCRG